VAGVRFDVKRRDELEREALKDAVGRARARADAAAAGAGRTVERVIRIEDGGAVGPPPRPMPMAAARAEALEVATPVAPGELEIRATVTLTVALKEKGSGVFQNLRTACPRAALRSSWKYCRPLSPPRHARIPTI
jgi:uncharacterized protein YggE